MRALSTVRRCWIHGLLAWVNYWYFYNCCGIHLSEFFDLLEPVVIIPRVSWFNRRALEIIRALRHVPSCSHTAPLASMYRYPYSILLHKCHGAHTKIDLQRLFCSRSLGNLQTSTGRLLLLPRAWELTAGWLANKEDIREEVVASSRRKVGQRHSLWAGGQI